MKMEKETISVFKLGKLVQTQLSIEVLFMPFGCNSSILSH